MISKHKKDTYIKYNVSTEFKDQVMQVADKLGMSVSDFARYNLVDGLLEQTIWTPDNVNKMIEQAMIDSKNGNTIITKTAKESREFLESL